MLTRLIEEDTFSEAAARFYVAEMILSLREVHQTLGAIHRDVRPRTFASHETFPLQ